MLRPFLIIILCVFASIAVAQKPNIIYIYADDLGYGELGCYGQERIKTPNIDKLAAEGVRFTNHYTGSPVCAPARCILMTGKHSGHSYIRGNYELGEHDDAHEGGQMPLPEGTFTIAQMMKQAGYITGAIGKWGLGMWNNTGDPNKQGFDYFYGYLDQKQAHNHYPTHLWENGKKVALQNQPYSGHARIPADSPDSLFDTFRGKDFALTEMGFKTLAFLQTNKTKPFFLYLPYTSPHLALQVPEDALNEYKGKFQDKPYFGENGYTPVKYPLATYAAMITYLDKQVGIVMNMLKKLGLEKNTIVMFSSDNGPTFDVGGVDAAFFNSTAGLRGRKQDLYEGGIREPFIVKWPGVVKAGTISHHISAQYDVMATLADIIKMKTPSGDGLSFLNELKGNKQLQHPFLYFEFPEKSGQVAVRMGSWKGVKSGMQNNPSPEWELFDLDKDPFEKNNLAASHPEIIKQMEGIVLSEHMPGHIREWEFVQPKFLKKN